MLTENRNKQKWHKFFLYASIIWNLNKSAWLDSDALGNSGWFHVQILHCDLAVHQFDLLVQLLQLLLILVYQLVFLLTVEPHLSVAILLRPRLVVQIYLQKICVNTPAKFLCKYFCEKYFVNIAGIFFCKYIRDKLVLIYFQKFWFNKVEIFLN